MTLRSTAFALLAVTLAACASRPPPMPDPAPVAVEEPDPDAPQMVDGTYNAVGALQRGNRLACGDRTAMTIQIRDNRFVYVLNQPQVPWRRSVRFAVTVARDGSFESVANTAAIRGTIRNGHMQGELIGDACAFSFQSDRGGSW